MFKLGWRRQFRGSTCWSPSLGPSRCPPSHSWRRLSSVTIGCPPFLAHLVYIGCNSSEWARFMGSPVFIYILYVIAWCTHKNINHSHLAVIMNFIWSLCDSMYTCDSFVKDTPHKKKWDGVPSLASKSIYTLTSEWCIPMPQLLLTLVSQDRGHYLIYSLFVDTTAHWNSDTPTKFILRYRVFVKYCVFSLDFFDFSELFQLCCKACVLPAWCVYTN